MEDLKKISKNFIDIEYFIKNKILEYKDGDVTTLIGLLRMFNTHRAEYKKFKKLFLTQIEDDEKEDDVNEDSENE